MTAEWVHVKEPEDKHPADGHYASDGKWVCFKCREPVKLKEPE